MKLKIGIFDSGIGGFTILSTLMKTRQDIEVFYLADTKRVPYGNKNIWEKSFKTKVNKKGKETKRKEKIVYDDGNQMKVRKQKNQNYQKLLEKLKLRNIET